MAKVTSNGALAQRIEALVREHIADSRRTAQEALERAFGSAAARPSKAPRRAATKSAVASQRRSPEEVMALGDALYAAVCAHPGEAMARLAREVDASARELNRPMARLKSEGRVRTVGARQLTRYFPMASSAAPE